MQPSENRTAEHASFFLLIGAALCLRIPYLVFWSIYFNSDTAVLGLMARHFLKGEFRPYYWGEAYYGALDPLLLAPLFKAFGATPAISNILPFVVSLAVFALYYRYMRRILDARSANIAALAFALVPPAFFQTTLGVYNYAFVLLFGIILLLLFERFRRGERGKRFLFFSGLALGFSWYYFRLIALFAAAMILTWLAQAYGPEPWRKFRERNAGRGFRRWWGDLVLLRRAALPRGLKSALVAVNFYNLVNFLCAAILWIRGDWSGHIGRLQVKLHLWPIFKSSLILAVLVAAVVYHRRVLAFLGRFRTDGRLRACGLGLLAGYAPALFGMLIGLSPSSPGGLVSVPVIVKNVAMAVPEMTTWMAGRSGVPLLQIPASAVAVAAFVLLLVLLWTQTRARFRSGSPVAPFYPVLALAFVTAGLGVAGAGLADANTLRFFVPLFFALPVGLALGLKKCGRKFRPFGWAILAVFFANLLLANLHVWRSRPSPSRFEKIAARLEAEGIQGGYADYWNSYAVTFLAGEKIIVAPLSGKERYPAYAAFVRSLDEIAVLGDVVSSGSGRVRIGEIEYDAWKRDRWESLDVLFLKKAGRPVPVTSPGGSPD